MTLLQRFWRRPAPEPDPMPDMDFKAIDMIPAKPWQATTGWMLAVDGHVINNDDGIPHVFGDEADVDQWTETS